MKDEKTKPSTRHYEWLFLSDIGMDYLNSLIAEGWQLTSSVAIPVVEQQWGHMMGTSYRQDDRARIVWAYKLRREVE